VSAKKRGAPGAGADAHPPGKGPAAEQVAYCQRKAPWDKERVHPEKKKWDKGSKKKKLLESVLNGGGGRRERSLTGKKRRKQILKKEGRTRVG